ncbi:hypothetical protein GDO86_011360 [Hymenochirus boettgeri]|uniref:Uncharacterized protein n=1 Tax=Hymenochirus boettgeri TaxID=247094 RepID=A0A8T2JBE1_9PIPI|nr:hypothetical protein GDO86_011360 [Hymenochirus boettgeri]
MGLQTSDTNPTVVADARQAHCACQLQCSEGGWAAHTYSDITKLPMQSNAVVVYITFVLFLHVETANRRDSAAAGSQFEIRKYKQSKVIFPLQTETRIHTQTMPGSKELSVSKKKGKRMKEKDSRGLIKWIKKIDAMMQKPTAAHTMSPMEYETEMQKMDKALLMSAASVTGTVFLGIIICILQCLRINKHMKRRPNMDPDALQFS